MKKYILLLFFVLNCLPSWATDIEEVELKHWTDKLGLAGNNVNCFTQDQKGFLWVGTNNGLNRFDGQSFLAITLGKQKKNLEIVALLFYKNNIYAYTIKGNYFQINTNNFNQKQLDINNLKDNYLKNKLLQLNDNKLENYNGDYFKLSKDGNLYRNEVKITGKFNNFYKDSRNRFWVSFSNGEIGYWDSSERKVITAISFPKLSLSSFNLHGTSASIESIIKEDKNGKVWFFRSNGNVAFWDYELNKVYTIENIKNHPYLKDAYKLFSFLTDVEIRSIFFDKIGNLWIGTYDNGMSMVHFKQKLFQFYQFDYSSKIGLADEDVSCPTALNNGNIWIGTWGGGINTLKKEDLKTSSPDFEIIPPKKGVQGSLQDGKIFPIFEDSKENIWVGTFTSGLNFLKREDRLVNKLHFQNYTTKNSPLPSNSIMNIYEDREGIIWISTDNGLMRYLPKEGKFESLFNELKNPNIFKKVYPFAIYEDGNKNLWISTRTNGLFKWDKKNNQITNIKKFNTFTTNYILNIVEYPKNSLWLAGLNGLYHYDLSKDSFDYKVVTKTLSTNHIESMILGVNKMLWLGTNKGLYAYNPVSNKAENIDLVVGVRNNQFTRGASKDANGFLYFGTRNGFYRFHPNKLLAKEKTRPLFTDLKIDGVSYRENKKRPLTNNDISSTSKIQLKYNENTFSIEYKNLNYSTEELTFYETSMTEAGNQDNWVSTRDASKSWHNLDDGEYVFKVRNSPNSGSSTLKIVISPPWWRNGLAYFIYFVIFVLGIYFLIDVLTKKAVNDQKKDQDEKFDKLRFKFFLNIAHEIRTPLTLIKGGIERLKEGNAVNNEYSKELNRIYKNTDRLSRLVNEVLDLKKIERTSISLNLKPLNLKWFLESVTEIFSSRENQISIILKMPKKPIWITTDKQLLESIVYNLISNAIKFSNKNAEIIISIFNPNENQISIQVKDNGIGIKKEEQQLIFERLYQSDEHLKTGTGLGLSIVKQYVKLLEGTINLESELNEGSVFTVTFPYKKEESSLLYTEDHTMIIPKTKKVSSLLIIDDEKELRDFIKEIFEQDYTILEAENGEEGLKLTKQHHPSLIISDEMMPVMTGIEFCNEMRKDISISHIPIILLTAKTGDEAEITALSAGADIFANKPFSQNVLKSQVHTLIENRKKLLQNFDHSINQSLSILATNAVDKDFLERFEKILEKKHEHSDLSIEELASEMAVSVSSFYGKIKSITGSSPVEFVRIYRLKKAAKLLKTTLLPVTEISEKCGFGTQKYFSNSFKKHFGMTPLEYRKN